MNPWKPERLTQNVNDWKSGQIDQLHHEIYQYKIRLDSLDARLRCVNDAYSKLLADRVYLRRALDKIAGPDDAQDPGMTNWAVLGKWAREIARDALNGDQVL